MSSDSFLSACRPRPFNLAKTLSMTLIDTVVLGWVGESGIIGEKADLGVTRFQRPWRATYQVRKYAIDSCVFSLTGSMQLADRDQNGVGSSTRSAVCRGKSGL